MSDVNAYQVGGDHYKSEYQHWDFVLDMKLGYLQGCASKYIYRWRKKEGIQSLQKAVHYIDKFIAAIGEGRATTSNHSETDVAQQIEFVHRFIKANDIQPQEGWCLSILCMCRDKMDAMMAKSILLDLLMRVSKDANQIPKL